MFDEWPHSGYDAGVSSWRAPAVRKPRGFSQPRCTITYIPRALASTSVTVKLIWRDAEGQAQNKEMLWRRGTTKADVTEWIEDYFALLDSGYQPNGFNQAPRPHCIRLISQGRVLAEIFPRPTQTEGSIVGRHMPLGGEFHVSPVIHAPPQEAKPNSGPSNTCALGLATSGALGDTSRRSPAEPGQPAA